MNSCDALAPRALDRRQLLRAGLGGAALAALGVAGAAAVAPSATAAGVGNLLPANTSLAPGERITSRNGTYSFVMQTDGNAVVYQAGGVPIWATGTNPSPGAFFSNQGDGNLVCYSAGLRPLWASGTNGRGVGDLDMQDDGNLVLYSAGRAVLWASGTAENQRQQAPGNDRVQLALALRGTRTTFQNVHVGGAPDRATAHWNILDTSDGKPALTSAYGHAGGRAVMLDTRMLAALVAVGQAGHACRISELAGAQHTTASSLHYQGRAVDIDYINGVASARAAQPVINILRQRGASYAIWEGGTHIHAQW